MPPAESPGSRLLLAGRRRGAEDEPGHPEGAGVPGDRRRLGMGPRAGGDWRPSLLPGRSFSALEPFFKKITCLEQGNPGPEPGELVNIC